MARKQPDPIFAAIAAHRESHEEFRAEARYLWAKRRQSMHAAEFVAVRKTYETATEKLVVTEVRTLAGVHVFAAYLANLQCCGTSDVAPGLYAIEAWDLSAGMDRIAECLARHAAKAPRRRRSTSLAEPLSLAA
ncbi:hypothetical protein MKK63_10095 [Methylobacterium sp. J-088]|uniref:hypothetical protein n=1 Tax=Methylobacterium sp. J-088 TaxID=2836664 RepID=UPI001FBAD5BE|nr:hypothetical protein [Methylobacterium sp. J-088]MCJ2063059.1 hypothetical protein [Methylobacterium sp. J-088]